MHERQITSEACVAEGVEWLCKHEPRFAEVQAQIGQVPLRLRPDGFAQLLHAIVAQQVSVASAQAIWKRLEEAGATSPCGLAKFDTQALRDLGLSRQKARYAQSLAEAELDYGALRQLPTDQVIKTLTAVTGIGVWTAEIYAKFSLGRADVMAAGDLALQEGARMVFDLPQRPKERALRQMAEAWSPWRSVAARLLWAYYAYEKSREGVT